MRSKKATTVVDPVHYTKATKAETAAAALRLWLHRYSQRRTPVVLYDTCEELQKGSRTSRQTLVVVHTLLASLDSKLSFSLDGKDEVIFFSKKKTWTTNNIST